MTNIIALNVPQRRTRLAERTAGLIACFAKHRRFADDVFWLKENAELLNILECTGQCVPEAALTPLAPFFDGLSSRLSFFPQYYRFLLSIGLDLEDLGMPGGQMEALCAWVAHQGLPDAELSDLQRAEARRLLARRGLTTSCDTGLDDRLRAFAGRSATFALPNKKAAYELTHIVFYLSEYGRRDPQLPDDAVRSLHYVGILAWLDQNMDLLAEVCVALRQANQVPNAQWEEAVRGHLRGYQVIRDHDAPLSDGYHEYLVSLWAVAAMGHDDRGAAIPSGRCVFAPERPLVSALRPVSALLFAFDSDRAEEWDTMRTPVMDALEPQTRDILHAAECSSYFERFFADFSRSSMAM